MRDAQGDRALRDRRGFRRLPGLAALWFAFERDGALFQFRESATWIDTIGVRYEFGIDGIALLLVLLTTLLGAFAFLSSWSSRSTLGEKEYYIFLLLLQTGMLGVFMALDFFLFYVFWEVMLVPMYFLIGIWGGPRKLYAAIKFFLYTLVGSVLMLLGILALYFYNSTGLLRPPGSGQSGDLRHRAVPRDRRRRFRPTCSSGSSSPSSSASPSRCRCSRSTPGCPTPTSRRRPRAR